MIFLKDTYLGTDLDVQGLISSAGCFLRIMNKDTRQIDLLCAVIHCYFPRITKIRTSTFPHFSPASLYIFFFSYSVSLLWKLPSGSEAIYGTFEHVLNGTIMRPSVPL